MPATTGTAANGQIENQLRSATAESNDYMRQILELYAPYMESGAASLDEYTKLLLGGASGLKGNDTNFDALLDQASNSLMANRATSGMLRSGATTGAVMRGELNFTNDYYENRLKQLMGGVQVGQYGTQGSASAYEGMSDNAKGLAEALANIQIAREGMASNERAAQLSAQAAKDAAKNTGGLFGGGGFLGTGIKISDRRMKTHIRKLGKLGKYTWYMFRYIGSKTTQIGVMAQDVQKINPAAVVKIGDVLAVNYGRL